MKQRELYAINNNHGIIIIVNEKQYLYMSISKPYLLTEQDGNKLFASLKRYISYMPLKKTIKINC